MESIWYGGSRCGENPVIDSIRYGVNPLWIGWVIKTTRYGVVMSRIRYEQNPLWKSVMERIRFEWSVMENLLWLDNSHQNDNTHSSCNEGSPRNYILLWSSPHRCPTRHKTANAMVLYSSSLISFFWIGASYPQNKSDFYTVVIGHFHQLSLRTVHAHSEHQTRTKRTGNQIAPCSRVFVSRDVFHIPKVTPLAPLIRPRRPPSDWDARAERLNPQNRESSGLWFM